VFISLLYIDVVLTSPSSTSIQLVQRVALLDLCVGNVRFLLSVWRSSVLRALAFLAGHGGYVYREESRGASYI
jgi:hypothetical protein